MGSSGPGRTPPSLQGAPECLSSASRVQGLTALRPGPQPDGGRPDINNSAHGTISTQRAPGGTNYCSPGGTNYCGPGVALAGPLRPRAWEEIGVSAFHAQGTARAEAPWLREEPRAFKPRVKSFPGLSSWVLFCHQTRRRQGLFPGGAATLRRPTRWPLRILLACLSCDLELKAMACPETQRACYSSSLPPPRC